MGTDNFYHKRKQGIKERKKGKRTPKANSFLIVSEGEKTEPIYFDGLAKHINDKYGNSIDVEKPIIDTCGEGKCTVSLVEATAKLVAQSKIMYSQIWVVFDKDDFKDFDEAVALAQEYDYHVAWSNESFEYWIYLHFYYSDSALHRSDWNAKLDEIFKKNRINAAGYNKNDPELFKAVTTNGSLKAAISNAFRIEERYNEKTQKPSEQNPCTKVHHLVNELKEYLDDLLY